MLRLFQWLVFGHVHKWKILEKRGLTYTHRDRVTDRGDRYVLQCERCGDVGKRDII